MSFYDPPNRRQCNNTFGYGNVPNTELVSAALHQGCPRKLTSSPPRPPTGGAADAGSANQHRGLAHQQLLLPQTWCPSQRQHFAVQLAQCVTLRRSSTCAEARLPPLPAHPAPPPSTGEHNPSRGVRLTYSGGDDCGPGIGKRSFTIAIQCADDAGNLPDTTEVVEETSTCQYEMIFRSAYGCPVQCPVVGAAGQSRLCNGQGVCDFDAQAQQPKCFCNEGWHGPGCETQEVPEKKPLVSPVGVVLIVVCIVLVFAGVLLWMLWSKVSSLRLDMSAYKSLAAEDALHAAAPVPTSDAAQPED